MLENSQQPGVFGMQRVLKDPGVPCIASMCPVESLHV